jgi:predicted nucleotide-binding protein (sugar kinase/HSP70/actin superfamily)
MGEILYLKVEKAWKHWQEEKLMKHLRQCGLVPEAPHDMEVIMGRAKQFAALEFDTEATLSPCVASLAMEEGYSGVAVIAPFACLPGRLIESIYAPYARARNWPVICLENDGNSYAPNVLSRIEVFAHNVDRG